MSKASTPKVAREVAEGEFARMCDAHRIETDTSELDESDAEELEGLKRPIMRALMTGSLIVGDDGNPTFTPPGGGPPVTFHKATAATYIALETYAGKKDMANMIAAICEMTRSERGAFAKMEAPDFQVCLRLGKLFLQDR